MPDFSRRHYEVIAQAINDTISEYERDNNSQVTTRVDIRRTKTIGILVRKFSDVLKNDNPAFDEAKFKKACIKK